MNSNWFNAAVVMLWLATMSWLVKEQFLPPLLIGEPPSYSRLIEAQKHVPVGWRISLSGRRLGWALSETVLQPTGLTEIRGRVHFDAVPLETIMPGWMHALSHLTEQPIGTLRMDATSLLTIDSLGKLASLDSAVRLDPMSELIHMRGIVEGQQLQLTVSSGSVSFNRDIDLPEDALFCDALSPQSQLPGLRLYQKWTVPIFSPLHPAKTPLEIIHANVDSREFVFWNGMMQDCWLVVYRSDSGTEAANNQDQPRGRLWVARDGTVLRQQVLLFDAVITFDRLTDAEAKTLAQAAGSYWWNWDDDHRRRWWRGHGVSAAERRAAGPQGDSTTGTTGRGQ